MPGPRETFPGRASTIFSAEDRPYHRNPTTWMAGSSPAMTRLWEDRDQPPQPFGGGPSSGCSIRRATRPPPFTWVSRIRSEEHTSELQSLMRLSYAVFCLKKKNHEN